MNKINKKLLVSELENSIFKINDVVVYKKDFFQSLLSRFSDVEIFEEYYCCKGLEQHCWMEIYRKGNWV